MLERVAEGEMGKGRREAFEGLVEGRPEADMGDVGGQVEDEVVVAVPVD